MSILNFGGVGLGTGIPDVEWEWRIGTELKHGICEWAYPSTYIL